MSIPSVTSSQANAASFPSAKVGKEEPKKDLLDHIAHRGKQSFGAWDFFRVVSHVNQYPILFSSLSEGTKGKIQNFKTAADLAGAALSFPTLFGNINDIRHRYRDLQAAKALPDSDPAKKQKVKEASVKTTIEGCNAAWSLSTGVLFLHDAKLVNLGKGYPAVAGINNVVSVVTDGYEGLCEVGKLKQHKEDAKKAVTQEEKDHICKKVKLSWMTIVKSVASVAVSVLILTSLAFAAVMKGFIFLPILILGLSTTWLVMKIVSYFYEEILKDKTPPQHVLAKV